MSFFRVATLMTAFMVAGLYGVRALLESKLAKYSEPLAELLDPNGEVGYSNWEERVQRLHRIVFLLHDAESELVDVQGVLDKALARFDYSSDYAPMLKKSLVENVRIAQMNGLFTDENRDRILRGGSPLITTGAFSGEAMDAQAVIPSHLAPEIGMNFANLIYTPHATVLTDQSPAPHKAERAREFYAASFISRDTLHYIMRSLASPNRPSGG